MINPYMCSKTLFLFLNLALSSAAIAVHHGKVTDNRYLAIGKMMTIHGYDTVEVCTLTRISPKHAITAAHCFRDMATKQLRPASQILITFPDSPKTANPISIISKALNVDEEVAIVELAKVHQSQNFIPTVKTDPKLQSGQEYLFVGYGTAQDKGHNDPKLVSEIQRSGMLTYEGLKKYNFGYELTPFFPVSSNFPFYRFKRGSLNEAMICSGDSGGPLLVEIQGVYKIAGIASHTSTSKCESNTAGQFMPVFLHKDWIKTQVGAL